MREIFPLIPIFLSSICIPMENTLGISVVFNTPYCLPSNSATMIQLHPCNYLKWKSWKLIPTRCTRLGGQLDYWVSEYHSRICVSININRDNYKIHPSWSKIVHVKNQVAGLLLNLSGYSGFLTSSYQKHNLQKIAFQFAGFTLRQTWK